MSSLSLLEELLNTRSNLLVEEAGSWCTGKGSLKMWKSLLGCRIETRYFLCARNAFRESRWVMFDIIGFCIVNLPANLAVKCTLFGYFYRVIVAISKPLNPRLMSVG